MPGWFDPRRWWRRIVRLWRSSLSLRTITATVLLSTAAAVGVGIAIDVSVSQSLIDARRDQLVTLSQSATVSAQRVFDTAAGQPDSDPDATLNDASRAIQSAAATTSGGTSYALRIVPGQTSAAFPPQASS